MLVIAPCLSLCHCVIFLLSDLCDFIDWTFFICSDTEEDQQAEGSLQRLPGPICLEPVDFLENRHYLNPTLSAPAVSVFIRVYNVLLSFPLLFFTIFFWLSPYTDGQKFCLMVDQFSTFLLSIFIYNST